MNLIIILTLSAISNHKNMNITLNFLNRSKMVIILEDQLLKVRNIDRTKKNKKGIYLMRI